MCVIKLNGAQYIEDLDVTILSIHESVDTANKSEQKEKFVTVNFLNRKQRRITQTSRKYAM